MYMRISKSPQAAFFHTYIHRREGERGGKDILGVGKMRKGACGTSSLLSLSTSTPKRREKWYAQNRQKKKRKQIHVTQYYSL